MKDIRIAFFGTPELAVYVLDELKRGGIAPALVVTAPDRKAGRKLVLTPPPVKVWAEEYDIEVLQPESLKNSDELEILKNSEWDLFIVAAYTIFLPKYLLELPKYGVLNVHPSLLPKLRGPSPIRTAIRDDLEDETGVSVILLDEEMDHGPIVAQATVELPEWPVQGRVLDELLFREGGRLLLEVIPEWVKKTITPDPQEHGQATYTQQIAKADGELHLDGDAYENYCKYCAYDGWPGVFFFEERNGKTVRVKVTDALFENGQFLIQRVIPEGKKEMSYTDWMRNADD